ncbi:MAG: hypothetical protein ACK56I_35670, partial [bacterium]
AHAGVKIGAADAERQLRDGRRFSVVVLRSDAHAKDRLLDGRFRWGRHRGMAGDLQKQVGFADALEKRGKIGSQAIWVLQKVGLKLVFGNAFNECRLQGRG